MLTRATMIDGRSNASDSRCPALAVIRNPTQEATFNGLLDHRRTAVPMLAGGKTEPPLPGQCETG